MLHFIHALAQRGHDLQSIATCITSSCFLHQAGLRKLGMLHLCGICHERLHGHKVLHSEARPCCGSAAAPAGRALGSAWAACRSAAAAAVLCSIGVRLAAAHPGLLARLQNAARVCTERLQRLARPEMIRHLQPRK